MKLLKYIVFGIFLLSYGRSKAQETMRQYEAGVTYHYGYILAKQGNGKHDWHVKYNYPYFGLSTMFFDFGNPEQLGKGFSLMAFYNFPIVRKRNFEFLFKLIYLVK